MKVYPSWRFHRTLPPCIVADPDADDALGEGWAMTPAAFLEPEPAAKPPAAETPAAEPPPKPAGHAAAVLLEEHRPAKQHKPEPEKCLKPANTKTKTKHRKR